MNEYANAMGNKPDTNCKRQGKLWGMTSSKHERLAYVPDGCEICIY